jgi:hypothetical protein
MIALWLEAMLDLRGSNDAGRPAKLSTAERRSLDPFFFCSIGRSVAIHLGKVPLKKPMGEVTKSFGDLQQTSHAIS